jgi:hypothetical protein
MRRRLPWGLLLGVGAGFLLARAARSGRRKRGPKGIRAAPGGQPQVLHEAEVVRSRLPTPVEAGLERPVASGFPETIPERSTHAVPPLHQAESSDLGAFEPVIPDAPERRDPAAEPRGGGGAPATPVPPGIRKRH